MDGLYWFTSKHWEMAESINIQWAQIPEEIMEASLTKHVTVSKKPTTSTTTSPTAQDFYYIENLLKICSKIISLKTSLKVASLWLSW